MKSRDLWVFEGYDTHTGFILLLLVHHTNCAAVYQRLRPCVRMLSHDPDAIPISSGKSGCWLSCFPEQFLDLHFGYRWTSVPTTPMIQQNSLRFGLLSTTVVKTHLSLRGIESDHKWWLFLQSSTVISLILSKICCTRKTFACTLLLNNCYVSFAVNVR